MVNPLTTQFYQADPHVPLRFKLFQMMLLLILNLAGRRYLVGPETKVDMYLSASMEVATLETISAQQIAFFEGELGWAFDRLYYWGFHMGTFSPPLVLRDTIINRDIPLRGMFLGSTVGIVPISGLFVHPLLQVKGGVGFVSDARDGIGYNDLYTYFAPAAGVEFNITPYIKAGATISYRYLLNLNPDNINARDPMGPAWGVFFKLAGY